MRRSIQIPPAQEQFLALLGLTNNDIGSEDLRGVRARVRLWREGQELEASWQYVTLYLGCFAGRVACVALERFNWAEYSVEDHFDPNHNSFEAEGWFMEVGPLVAASEIPEPATTRTPAAKINLKKLLAAARAVDQAASINPDQYPVNVHGAQQILIDWTQSVCGAIQELRDAQEDENASCTSLEHIVMSAYCCGGITEGHAAELLTQDKPGKLGSPEL